MKILLISYTIFFNLNQLTYQNDQDIDYESDDEDNSILPCDININYNTLKEYIHTMKFKDNKIESAKYIKKSVNDIINEQNNISDKNKSLLKETLKYFDILFDGTLWTYKYNTFSLKLKPNTALKYHKPYPIPLKYYEKVKEEIDRLEKLNIIEKRL